MAKLQEVLEAGIRAGDTEAASAIRDLIDTVVVRRDNTDPDGFVAKINGRLDVLLGTARNRNGAEQSVGKLVAGARYVPLQIEMRPMERFLAGVRRVA